MGSPRVRTRTLALAASVLAALSIALLPAGAGAAPSLADAEKQVAALAMKMDATNEDYNDAKVDLAKVKAEQAGLTKKLDAANVRLDVSRDAVGVIAAAALRDGQLSLGRSLMASGSAQSFLDRMALYEQLSLEQRTTIEKAAADSKAVDAAKAEVDGRVTKAADLEKKLAAQKASLTKDLKKWEEMRRKLYSQKGYGTTSSARVTYNGQASGSAAAVVRFALAQQGKPYVFGADGPGSYDCSGLTMASWRQVGVSLPHSAKQQYNSIPHVSRANLQPGDIVFFYNPIHHNGIYIGNGQVVHAPHSGSVVKVVSLSSMPFAGAGRP